VRGDPITTGHEWNHRHELESSVISAVFGAIYHPTSVVYI